MENLDAKTFKEKTTIDPNAVIIDVRSPAEEVEGLIENSININIMDPSFTEKIKELSREKNYYVYCRKGGRSASACGFMESNGFKNTFNLIGGIEAWNDL